MIEFKGTKGNWVWNKGNYHDWISTQDENEIICRMGQPCLNLSVLYSNALLISKAPEMLEFITRVRDTMPEGSMLQIEAKQLIEQATEL